MTNTTCSIDECERRPIARTLCGKHYQRAVADGTRVSLPRQTADPSASLDARLRKIGWTVTDSGCWEWNGYRDPYNYGKITIRQRTTPASRIAFEAWVKAPEPGMDICHRCDNPPCINPSHLFEGSRAVNVHDAINKRRHSHGERHTHKLTDEQVQEIRERYEAKELNQYELARAYGVSQSHVSLLILRRLRKHETHYPAA